MKFIIIALVLLSLTGCMVLFETVEEEITFQVRVDNLTTLDLTAQIAGVSIIQPPGLSAYTDAVALAFDGEDHVLIPVYVSESGLPLIKRTTVRVHGGGLYTLTVWYDELGGEYRFTWGQE